MLRQKQVSVLIVFLLTLCLYSLSGKNDCFTIVVGKSAAADGSVLVAHNEDDREEGKIFFVNVHKIPGQSYKNGATILLKNKGTLPQVKQTTGFLWLQIPEAEFGDAYINENGVVIASNQCSSREDKPILTNGGIGFMLRRILAERATSARNAVEIAGKLIRQFGYYSSGRSYAIADATEAWVFHAVNGKHWIARRVPDHHAAVIANRYTIENVHLADKKNYLGSPDIIDYAVKRGWYRPGKDGAFNFAKAYSLPENYQAELNVLRQWRGTALLAKKRYKLDEPLPFSFAPRKNLKPADLFNVLRDHYEETEHDLTNDYKEGSPNRTKKRTICTESTQYSFVAQLREELPKEIAHLVWIAFRRPDSNAFSPWYASITAPPEGYNQGNSENALKNHFKVPPSFSRFNPDYSFWTFAKLSRLVDQDYRPRIKIARKEWRNFENYIMKTLKKMEKEFGYLVKKRKNRDIALKIITNYIKRWEYRKWFLALELIDEMEKK